MNEVVYIEKNLKDNAYVKFHYSQAVKEATIKITQKTCVNKKFKTSFSYSVDVSLDIFEKVINYFLFKKEIDKKQIIDFVERLLNEE